MRNEFGRISYRMERSRERGGAREGNKTKTTHTRGQEGEGKNRRMIRKNAAEWKGQGRGE